MVTVVLEAVAILSSKVRISKDKVEAAVQTDRTRMDSRISRTAKALVLREVSNRMATKTRMEMVVAHLQLRSPINLAMTATNSLVAVLDNKEISRNPVRMMDKISNLETGSRTVSPEIRMVRTNKAMVADSLAIISKMAKEISKAINSKVLAKMDRISRMVKVRRTDKLKMVRAAVLVNQAVRKGKARATEKKRLPFIVCLPVWTGAQVTSLLLSKV